jgi:hypothetical protein
VEAGKGVSTSFRFLCNFNQFNSGMALSQLPAFLLLAPFHAFLAGLNKFIVQPTASQIKASPPGNPLHAKGDPIFRVLRDGPQILEF